MFLHREFTSNTDNFEAVKIKQPNSVVVKCIAIIFWLLKQILIWESQEFLQQSLFHL